LSLFDQQIDLRNNPGDIKLIDLKFDLVLKSAFEQVKGANKPAKCAHKSISSKIAIIVSCAQKISMDGGRIDPVAPSPTLEEWITKGVSIKLSNTRRKCLGYLLSKLVQNPKFIQMSKFEVHDRRDSYIGKVGIFNLYRYLKRKIYQNQNRLEQIYVKLRYSKAHLKCGVYRVSLTT
jgi:hypothetical protein